MQSIYIPSSIRHWYREVKIWAKDRQCSFCLWILSIKNTKILRQSTWKHRVLHSTCIQHGRNIKTRCVGSISNLLKRKDERSIKRDRTTSSFTIHSQPVVSRRLSRWIRGKLYTKKCMNHLDRLRRFSWAVIGWRNWAQELLDKQQAPNQPN